ncbi:MAG: hypothetical protein QF415_01480 [Candidatus Undinarchaeales archaeon]|jgi:hypothetical protein|nr:hypothetical protein [Candidatus Undinarchaeales archaeon]MDP7493377.1 hypothetical protein [Candidatus Undinarchaeales archaeon]
MATSDATDDYNELINAWLYRLGRYTLIFLILVVPYLSILRYNGFFENYNVNNARYMISSLIQSEAAMISIIVASSLIVLRLSPRSIVASEVRRFRESPDLWILLGIYLVAMGYGLVTLNTLGMGTTEENIVSNFQIAFVLYLGIFAFASIIPYVWNLLSLMEESALATSVPIEDEEEGEKEEKKEKAKKKK